MEHYGTILYKKRVPQEIKRNFSKKSGSPRAPGMSYLHAPALKYPLASCNFKKLLTHIALDTMTVRTFACLESS